jgi:hypothetical protein
MKQARVSICFALFWLSCLSGSSSTLIPRDNGMTGEVSPVIGVLLVMIIALTPKSQNIDKSCMINQV